MAQEKLKHIAERVTIVLTFIFPLLLAIMVQVRSLALSLSSISFWMTVPLALVFLAYLVYRATLEEINPFRQWIEVAIAVFSLVAIRLLLITMLSSSVESDFWDIHRFAVDLANGQGLLHAADYSFIPRVTYNNTTAGLLSIFYRLFGASIRVGKLVMVCFSGLAGLAIYAAARRCLKSHAAGIVAVLAFAFWPALIAFTGMTSPDHIAIFLIALVFTISTRLEAAAPFSRKSILLLILLGITIGLVDWFRPVGIVLCLAMILSDILYTDWRTRKSLLFLAARVAGLLVVFAITSGLSVTLFERILNRQLPANNQRMGESLYIGMNMNSGGMYSLDDSKVIAEALQKYGADSNAFNRNMLSLAQERFSANRGLWADLLRRKFITAWAGHKQLFEFALHGSNDQELVGYLEILDAILTPAIFLGVLISVAVSLCIRPGRTIYAMILYILGFALLLLATEVQNRYRLALVPVMVILAAHGYICLAGWLVKSSAAMRPRRLNSTRTTGKK